ncbi:hypothetical protein ES703_109510 [subsurface metagenome]
MTCRVAVFCQLVLGEAISFDPGAGLDLLGFGLYKSENVINFVDSRGRQVDSIGQVSKHYQVIMGIDEPRKHNSAL